MKLKEILAALLIGATLFSCEKDDPEDIHEHEVFSNVSLHLTPQDGGDEVEFHWHDENGDLVVDADEIESGSLAASTVYSAVVSFDEEEEDEDHDHDHDHDEDEHESLDKEIKEEADEHQLFFSAITGLTVTYDDQDENGLPLGLETTFTTDATYAGGDLTISLRHEPTKDAAGVSDGDITNAGGENDVEVTFNLGAE